jgi:N-acetylglucosamine kinase-like BadF-type ATPase
MDYVLGVDVGNTKTIALVAQSDGTILGGGRDGCGDIYGARSAEAALAAIESAATQALQQAGVHAEALAAGAFNCAGADWPEDYAFLEAEFRQRRFGRQIVVVNDGIGALRAGLLAGIGVGVVCGTGAATGARGPDGRTWHASFWQEPQGAEHLARKALRAVYRTALGIDPPTALTPAVLAYFGQASVEEVLHLCTARIGSPPANLPGLARVLLDVAEDGDPTARRLIEEHGAALGDYALAAARQVGIAAEPFPLVLAGGVLRHPSPLLTAALIARVQAGAPGAHSVKARFEPAVGALFLALEAAGVAVDEALLARLVPTLPPPLLFAT